MRSPQYLADFSLALINRTGAYYVCRDVVQNLKSYFPAVRYWRSFLNQEPQGLRRKLLGRAMLYELSRLGGLGALPRPRRSRAGDLPTLYLDPLYVLRTRLEPRDIVLCHDVGPLTHRDLFDAGTTAMYERAYAAIKDAKPGVVFVSEASRTEFIALFGDDFRFLKVIPLYVRDAVAGGEETPPPGVTKPFLLTVGALEVRKNHRRIIGAFESSGLRERGYSYVFCGPRGNSAAEVQELARAIPGVHGFGYLSDAEVRWLYNNATGFVLPSLLEGFGLPPLEAAQRGLVSIVSRDGAQKEAVGDGAILVDPKSVQDIASGMRQLADMPAEERQRRLDLARAHAAALSQTRYVERWNELLSSN
jgi:glycosyltransferase involved in cell wall biosynthesis